ncbi:hypothetical protein NDU88_007700 [Pleurodeles waltl]|uniref:Uncharacterized protein n=1 Tax=Pleurodeles waltl TaxID=8319 RepID=A0AAV7ST48_PLEWA|nr:hypothetical protein NDU88_007700 [Pleurodeles waltl]
MVSRSRIIEINKESEKSTYLTKAITHPRFFKFKASVVFRYIQQTIFNGVGRTIGCLTVTTNDVQQRRQGLAQLAYKIVLMSLCVESVFAPGQPRLRATGQQLYFIFDIFMVEN